MDNRQSWWDDFWKKQAGQAVSGERESDTWYDLIWKMNFEFWHALFHTSAPGKKMLECGCGSAKVSQYMAGKGFECTLLDYSRDALHQGKSCFQSQGLLGDFVLGDINSLCFQDQLFDIVFSGGVLEYFNDLQNPIDEMVRILKPGGVFAANMVPRKFSIQTVADLERTFVYSARSLAQGRFRDVFKRVEYVPEEYGVNLASLDKYTRACRAAGLHEVKGLVTNPFPELALPLIGKKMYASLMKKLSPQWRRFNLSESRWTQVWGTTYTVYGIKK